MTGDIKKTLFWDRINSAESSLISSIIRECIRLFWLRVCQSCSFHCFMAASSIIHTDNVVSSPCTSAQCTTMCTFWSGCAWTEREHNYEIRRGKTCGQCFNGRKWLLRVNGPRKRCLFPRLIKKYCLNLVSSVEVEFIWGLLNMTHVTSL